MRKVYGKCYKYLASYLRIEMQAQLTCLTDSQDVLNLILLYLLLYVYAIPQFSAIPFLILLLSAMKIRW
jgi:hypothetical protein